MCTGWVARPKGLEPHGGLGMECSSTSISLPLVVKSCDDDDDDDDDDDHAISACRPNILLPNDQFFGGRFWGPKTSSQGNKSGINKGSISWVLISLTDHQSITLIIYNRTDHQVPFFYMLFPSTYNTLFLHKQHLQPLPSSIMRYIWANY